MWYTKTPGLDPVLVRQAHLYNSIVSKYYDEDEEDNERLKAAALAKFMHAESRCHVINECGRYYSELTGRVNESVISRARTIISRVLGDVQLDSIFKHRMPTSGGTTSRTRREAHPVRKLLPHSRQPHVTKRALPYAFAYVSSSHGLTTHFTERWRGGWFRLRDSSKLSFVPKNNREHRIICSEPDMNIILQRCVGDYICKRLCKYGVNLHDQGRNQALARIGSITGRLATVDLSAASDSIAVVTVQDLLPYEWFSLLMDLRCDYVFMPDGSLHTLEKISSMGNGYTFELESLIFWALTVASCEEMGFKDPLLAVYGDDIILPTECVGVLSSVLTYLGFLFNEDKSFVSGPFRESCGKHYYSGVDVTPYYVKKLSSLGDWFLWANNHLHWCGGVPDAFYKQLVRGVPFDKRCTAPENSGDKRAGFMNPYGCRTEPVKVRHGRVFKKFRQLTAVKVDETDRYSDESRYYSWFLTRTPPEVILFYPYTLRNRRSAFKHTQIRVEVLGDALSISREIDYVIKPKWIEVRDRGSREAV